MATRRERVVLELQDEFSREILAAAAATKVLDHELNKLGGRAGRDQTLKQMSRDAVRADRDVSNLGRTAERTGAKIDTMSGRVSVFGDALALIGPGAIPIAAIAVPAVTGLAAQFGFAAAGAGVLIGSMQGVGDALKAVNKAQLEPTEANLQAAHLAMSQLSTEAQAFVKRLQQLEPELKKLRDIGAANMLPGFTEGLDGLESALPRVQGIVASISAALGDIGADAGESLGSDRWAPFLDFIAQEAPQALRDMSKIAGSTAHAMAQLWMAFDPVNDDFSTFLVTSSRDLDRWATGLSKTAGFQEFVDYIDSTGPQVGATLGAIGNAFLQVVEAAAPMGGPVLHILEDVANVIAKIADSPLGTPILAAVGAWRAYAVAASLAEKAQLKFNAAQAGGFGTGTLSSRANSTKAWAAQTKRDLGVVATTWATAGARTERESARMAQSTARLSKIGRGAAGVAALGVAATGAADKIGLAATASLGLTGWALGGPIGAAVGAGAGAVIDLTHANDGLQDSLAQLAAISGKVDFETFNKKLHDTQKKVDDLKHVTGVGDWFGDAFTQLGNVIGGKGLDGGVKNAEQQRDAAVAAQDLSLRTRGAALANQQMAASSELAAHGLQLTAAGAREAGMTVDQFTRSMEGANAALQRQGAWDSYRRNLLDAKDAVASSGKTLQRNGDIIKGQGRDVQRAGLQSRDALRTIASGAIDLATKMRDAGKRTEFLQNARRDFIALAQGMGVGKVAAQQLASELGLIDRTHAKPTVEEQGADASRGRIKKMRDEISRIRDRMVHMDEKGAEIARGKIAALRDAINALRDRTIRIHYDVTHSGVAPAAATHAAHEDRGARGMLFDGAGVRRYAFGDIANRHQAELAGPGPTRVWREPETQGEAYIPLANDARRPRAQAIAAETVRLLGGTASFAGGGIAPPSYQTSAGLSVYFPTPTALQQYVAATNQIAVAAANTARSAEDTRQAHLADLQAQQRIRDLNRSLNERTKKTVGKGKNRHQVKGGYVLKGLDRQETQAELADARAQLTAVRKISEAGQQAIDALTQARSDAKASLEGGLDLFAGSAGTAVRNADRYVADIAAAGQVMAQLRAKGASSQLLAQMAQHVQQGDARGAVRLGQQFLAHPELLTSLNASLSTLGSVSASVAALTSDPRFLQTGSWNPAAGGAGTKVVRLELGVDPSSWTTDITRRAVAEITAALNGGG